VVVSVTDQQKLLELAQQGSASASPSPTADTGKKAGQNAG